MFDQITDQLADKAKHTAQTAAFGLGAFLCLAVGGVFLTIAAWLFLLTLTTALIACLIIGSFFFGLGLIIIAAISMREKSRKQQMAQIKLQAKSAQTTQVSGGIEGIAGVIIAFINGMNAGRKSRF